MQDSEEKTTSPFDQWFNHFKEGPILQLPLQFMFPPVQTLSKELTKLNSVYQYRIVYLGPRWNTSTTFHKKYSRNGEYDFNQRRVNKNNPFFQNSMNQNQFYKNQIYYRAFQGMNPTLNLEEQLVFQSRFQGGNLDCVVKVSPQQYDLFLRIDSNTRGHLSWFYFSIKNGKRETVKLNICNLTKHNTHFSNGLKPFVYSSTTKEWTSSSLNAVYGPNKLRYDFLYQKINMPTLYQLSFDLQFNNERQIKVAYCIPYTYSDLAKDINEIRSVSKVGSLGSTLTGIDIPVVIVGSEEAKKKKKVIFVTARIHPGESNSSIMIAAMMKKLCLNPEMSYLREKYITVFVPMLNPDGVILGNSRCGALGKDLNRQFKSNQEALVPEAFLLKKLITKIKQTHLIEMYLDFHGHSCRKNMFMFGPNYLVSQNLYYKCRVLPKLLSYHTPIFRYYGCNYEIPPDKKTTARAIMLSEMMIPFVYTVETSLGFYYDRNTQKNIPFDSTKWQQLGYLCLISIKQYYQGMDQMQSYMQGNRKARKNIGRGNDYKLNIITRKKGKSREREENGIQMLQILEEIKQLEGLSKNQKEESDSDSDSHDAKEDLEKQKQSELVQMVSQYLETQETQNKAATEDKTFINTRTGKPKKLRRKQEKQKAQEQLFVQFPSDFTDKNKKIEVLGEARDQIRCKCECRRFRVVSHQFRKHSPQKRQVSNTFEKTLVRSKKYSESDANIMEKKQNKLNVRLFNFHKVVSESDKSLNTHFQNARKFSKQERQFPWRNEVNPLHSFKLHFNDLEKPAATSCQHQEMDNSSEEHKFLEIKAKNPSGFPSSYSKLHYHNLKKKVEMKEKSSSVQYDVKVESEQKREQKQGKCPQKMIQSFPNKKKDIDHQNNTEKYPQQKRLFAKISQFPLL